MVAVALADDCFRDEWFDLGGYFFARFGPEETDSASGLDVSYRGVRRRPTTGPWTFTRVDVEDCAAPPSFGSMHGPTTADCERRETFARCAATHIEDAELGSGCGATMLLFSSREVSKHLGGGRGSPRLR